MQRVIRKPKSLPPSVEPVKPLETPDLVEVTHEEVVLETLKHERRIFKFDDGDNFAYPELDQEQIDKACEALRKSKCSLFAGSANNSPIDKRRETMDSGAILKRSCSPSQT